MPNPGWVRSVRLLYSLALHLLIPVVVLRLLWRGLRARGYWKRWAERFGGVPALQDARPLWVHAVSVGEVQAAAPLIRALQERHPEIPLLVTTTTPTGAQRVRDLFGEAVMHLYAPYDLPLVVSRYLERIAPRLLVVMETELWPNLFRACRQRGVAVIVANGRLSERSAQGYRRLASLTRELLEDVVLVAAQSADDGRRFVELGLAPERLQVIGSLKFDVKVPASLYEQAAVLRRELGVDRPLWVAASTHEGEEAQVLEAFAAVREKARHALLVLVPRHPERFARVAALCRQQGYRVATRSSGEPCGAEVDIFLCDTMGELPLFYAAADLAYVGGSLVPVGGHNVLEPASVGVPVLFGPHMFNFAEVARLLLTSGGAWQVDDAPQLGRAVIGWLGDANLRHVAGEKAKAVVERNRGALSRLMALVEERLPEHRSRP